MSRAHRLSQCAWTAIAIVCGTHCALGQLNQNCTVSVLNRNIPVNADGTWVLPNVPANFGQVKARAVCIQNGTTVFGESAYFVVPANGAVNLPAITLGATTPIPTALAIAPSSLALTATGQTVQLVVTATYPDGSTKNVTASSTGTNYTISNPAIATITADGLVTAVSSGTVVIQANNDGATGIVSVPVSLAGANVSGIPVQWLLDHKLNPNDPLVAMEDPDRDGLTNLQEFQAGTDPNNPDTDGDGLSDGDEVNKYHTNPLLADTDGDGIPDGVEIQTGTDPLNAKSYDLKKAVATSTVTPPTLTFQTSIASPTVSIQLNWKVSLIDGKTTLDLTTDPRTTYKSSDQNICSFGGQAGLVFSGSPGGCVITLSQNNLSVPITGTVTGFTPAEVSSLNIPGAIAVDVAGNFAYIAAGTNGLAIVDVTDRASPRTRATLGSLGNARAVRASGQTIVVADANGFVRIVNAENPDAPVLLASLPITGTPNALALHGATAAVAASAGGISFVNIANPASPTLITSFSVPGLAQGVDFDPQTGVAAVAMGTAGLQLVDLSTLTSPKLTGLLGGGDVRRVLLKMPAALLADAQRSITAVDISNQAKPVISVSLPLDLGGVPVDIAGFGNIAITADTTFGRAIPIVNTSSPLNPSSVGFWTVGSPGYSSSIAVDLSFGYAIIPATGTLRILKYQNIVDTFGIPPVITLSAPAPGTILIQGQTVTVAANATDDVAVASVSLQVNGQSKVTTSSVPYQFNYTVPLSATTLTFGATAVDYGNNIGTAPNIVVPVIPDPLTTAVGRVLTSNAPVPGATVTAFGKSAITGTDGTFAIPGISTILGSIYVSAIGVVSGVTLAGTSATTAPVRGGTTNVGDTSVSPQPLITSVSPKSALAGTTAVSMTVKGANFAGASFTFSPTTSINITNSVVAADGSSATLTLDIPLTAVGTVALVSSSAAGATNSAATPVNRFTAVDPNSTADTDGDGFQDVIEAVFGTDPLDANSFPVVPAAREVESVAFSVLNAPVTGAGYVEVESVAFSVLNAPVTGAGYREVESTAFSVLNAPVTGAGYIETESVAFSVLNAPSSSAGINEAESYFSVLNTTTTAAPSATVTQGHKLTEETIASSPRRIPYSESDPFLDSDGDGLPDWYEMLIGTDPFNPDTDGDGLTDSEEVLVYRTNPLLWDTDGDGFPDGVEVQFGSDPLDPDSTPMNAKSPEVRQNASLNEKVTEPASHRDNRVNLKAKGDIHSNATAQKRDGKKASTVSLLLRRSAATVVGN